MLKTISFIGLMIVFSFWLAVGYMTVNKAIAYISYTDMKCVTTSTIDSSCDDFYENREEYLIEFI